MREKTILSIRLDPGPGPISGLVATDDEQREFSGWIELAGLIESLRPFAEAGRDASSADLTPAAQVPPGRPEAPRAS